MNKFTAKEHPRTIDGRGFVIRTQKSLLSTECNPVFFARLALDECNELITSNSSNREAAIKKMIRKIRREEI